MIVRAALAVIGTGALLWGTQAAAFAADQGVNVPAADPATTSAVSADATGSTSPVTAVPASPSTTTTTAASVSPANGDSTSVEALAVSASTGLPAVVVDPKLDDPQPPPFVGAGAVGRVGSGFAATPDGTAAVLYGGGDVFSGGLAVGDTWVWDGTKWTPKCGTSVPGATATCAPGPRDLVSEATGPTGVVLYGGQTSDGMGNTTTHADSYLWDGSVWQLICATCGPGARAAAAAAGNGSVALLFGGGDISGASPPLGDTWQFDGTSWTQANPGGTGQPSARLGASMAWDGHHFVLFGGLIQDATSQTSSDDTWIWTGAQWTQACGDPLGPCGPSPRILGGFANLASPDPTLQGALLVGGLVFTGGSAAPDLLGDIWYWNGQSWAQQASPWPDSTSLGTGFPTGIPFVGALAALRSSCQVSLAADMITDGSTPTSVAGTWNIGFDTNNDGAPGPCPDTVLTATPVPAPPAALNPSDETVGGMPRTGSDLARDGIAGIALALTGFTLIYASRRRRCRPLARP